MEPEYFNDDDLINDYLEDDNEQPPEEEFPDDFFMTEHFQQQPTQQQQSTQQQQPTTQQQQPTTQPAATTRESTTDHPKETVPRTDISIRAVSSQRKDALYSFERYNSGTDWRRKQNEESFEVKEWNRTKAASTGTARSKTSSSGPLLSTKLLQRLDQVSLDINTTSTNNNKNHGVSKFPVEGKNSVAMTVSGGARVHVATCNEEDTPQKSATKKKSSRHLLGVSMATLMARSDTITLTKAQQKRTTRIAHSSNDSQLWVDKYAPSTFSHLLSDEQTNRNVLRALRAWDPYVFRREAPKDRFPEKQDLLPTNYRDVRPGESHRVLLLSGPPGVGKTTLAHIVARHAGYQPMEVNASDDRSASVLQEKVVRAMESSTLTNDLQLGGKPNCIILDEVDGADAKTAIAALVNIIRAVLPEKGSKQKTTFLRRPIIFICNHKYAPALRPLLPYCQHFDVDPPSDQRLVARLRAILAKERLSSNVSTLLNQLVVGSGGDIRSCLFTLQFSAAKVRSKGVKKGGVVDLSSTLKGALGGGGLKDARTDLASTVATVFKKPKKQRDSPSDSSTQKVLAVVESFGENTKTLECLFTNLLQVSYVDPTMERCLLAHEWLSGGVDMSYMSSAAACAIHVLCRIETRVDLTLSNRDSSNAHFQREARRGILEKFVEGLHQSSYDNAITETVPYALWILSAADALSRPVSSIGILSKKELVAFDAHVSTLRSLGLTYVATTRPNSVAQQEMTSSVEMRLEPEIHQLVYFKGYRATLENRRKKVPSVLRELLAHGARVEIIRDREMNAKSPAKASSTKTLPPQKQITTAPASTKQKTSDEGGSSAGPPLKKLKIEPAPKNFLGIGAQKAKAARSARKKALVGFNNRVRAEKLTNSGSGVPLKQVIRFKYQKGFTQAVRTLCQMEDLV